MTAPPRAPGNLADRIFADLLHVRDTADIASAVALRVQHLDARQALIVMAQVVGFFMVTLDEVRTRSLSGAEVIQDIRDGLATHLITGVDPGERNDHGH